MPQGRGLQKSLHEVVFLDFSQTLQSRSGFDSEHEAFCADLNMDDFKQIGFIGLVRVFDSERTH